MEQGRRGLRGGAGRSLFIRGAHQFSHIPSPRALPGGAGNQGNDKRPKPPCKPET
jgi:hypothetical protein